MIRRPAMSGIVGFRRPPVPGTAGFMLTFDDFLEGVEVFGSQVMPLLD